MLETSILPSAKGPISTEIQVEDFSLTSDQLDQIVLEQIKKHTDQIVEVANLAQTAQPNFSDPYRSHAPISDGLLACGIGK